MPRKTISLGFELSYLVDVLDGVRAILAALTADAYDSQKDAQRLASSALAISNFILLRLHDLTDVVRHDLDPGALWAPHNDAGDVKLLPDVRFEEWPPSQHAVARRKNTPTRTKTNHR
jgi:hypothetical protein